MKTSIRFLAILALTALVGCAHTYQGPMPDLTAKGAAAKKQLETFTLDTPPWYSGYGIYWKGVPYTPSSMRPMMTSVSAEAARQLKKADDWRLAGLISAGVTLGLLGASIAADNWYQGLGHCPFFISSLVTLATELVTLSIGEAHVALAVEAFNSDLRKHFGVTQSRTSFSPRFQVSMQF